MKINLTLASILLGNDNPGIFLGPFSIKWYAILICLGIVLAFLLINREMKRQKFATTDDLLDFLLVTLPLSIIGARIYYVIFNFSAYQGDLLAILAIWQGGLAIYGGLIAGVIWTIVFCRRKNLSLFKMLDLLAPGVLVGQIIGRWGNFVNQEAYGSETSRHFLSAVLHLPNFIVKRMEIDGEFRQPTFLYESSWNLVGLIIILVLRHRNKFYLEGEVLASYLLWYSFGRFFIEGNRADSLYLFGTIRISQLLSLIIFIGALVFVIVRRKTGKISYYNLAVGA